MKIIRQSLTVAALTAAFSIPVLAQQNGGPGGPPPGGPAGDTTMGPMGGADGGPMNGPDGGPTGGTGGQRDNNVRELGKLLFFDKILSGNQNISCATCHHPLAALGDGLSLSVGAGGTGLGVTRETTSKPGQAIVERVPRNAPHLFVIGAPEFTEMFHDGRVATDPSQPGGFLSPAGENLPDGLDSLLAAQAMFPVTSAAEMAGQPGENPIADATAQGNWAGPNGVWDLLAGRLRNNTEYVGLFVDAFADVGTAGDISFVHVANAMAEFEANAWRCDNTPLDNFIRTGSLDTVSEKVLRGALLFYGPANCVECHSGNFQTDQGYHAIAMPQIGPG
ncbi:MAG: cytochrome-c peroxidase, partial [Pseudomonadota bacterium]